MYSFIKTLDDATKTMVFQKFQLYFGLDNQIVDMVFAPKGVSQRRIAEKRGEGSVEFISLWRTGIKFDWTRGNANLARKGILMEYTDADTKSGFMTVKAIPVKLTYDIRFWSRDMDRINEATEKYLFWQQENPNLLLNYVGLYPLEIDLHFGDIVDESPIEQEYEKGLYFVHKLPLILDGWIFSSFESKTILDIYLDLFLREGTPPNQTDTLVQQFHITSTTVS